MNSEVVLQLSHLIYLFSAAIAWNKGYRRFSLLLYGMIIVSIMNHYVQETLKQQNFMLEIVEKCFVIAVFIATAIQFRPYIRYTWILFFLSFIFFIVGNSSYYSVGASKEYFLFHTIWHFGTGYVLWKIIDRADDLKK